MEIMENIFNSRLGSYVIMIGIIVLFVGFLRLLYGPKGFLRKSLWDGIDDETTNQTTDETKKTQTNNPEQNLNK